MRWRRIGVVRTIKILSCNHYYSSTKTGVNVNTLNGSCRKSLRKASSDTYPGDRKSGLMDHIWKKFAHCRIDVSCDHALQKGIKPLNTYKISNVV